MSWTATVRRVGSVYLERDSDQIEVMIVEATNNAALWHRFYERGAEAFFVTFGELLLELYKDRYGREAVEAKKLEERVKELRSKGWDASGEEADLRRHEKEVLRYFRKVDALQRLLEEFKEVLEEVEGK
jgi:hypothetical protein